ncbi:hypothetical protein AgCh_027069 [Apium graveolens]
MAATTVACQGIWLPNVLSQVTSDSIGPVVLFIDNKSAIDLAKNSVFHGRNNFQILLKQDKSVLNWKSALILKSELKLSELKLSGDIYQEIISGLKDTFR